MSELEEIFTEEAPSLIGIGAEALVDNANRLGLTWVLRFGTVQTSDPLTVIVDGDTVPVSMVSLVGYLEVGTRVSVLIVSSKVHFVNGLLNADPPATTMQIGSASISFTTQTSFTQAVSFPVAFASTPVVMTNINSGSGSTGSWGSRAISIGTSGFTIFVFGPSATWSNVTVQWAAFIA